VGPRSLLTGAFHAFTLSDDTTIMAPHLDGQRHAIHRGKRRSSRKGRGDGRRSGDRVGSDEQPNMRLPKGHGREERCSRGSRDRGRCKRIRARASSEGMKSIKTCTGFGAIQGFVRVIIASSSSTETCVGGRGRWGRDVSGTRFDYKVSKRVQVRVILWRVVEERWDNVSRNMCTHDARLTVGHDDVGTREGRTEVETRVLMSAINMMVFTKAHPDHDRNTGSQMELYLFQPQAPKLSSPLGFRALPS
jgi:hypothetical protein